MLLLLLRVLLMYWVQHNTAHALLVSMHKQIIRRHCTSVCSSYVYYC